MSLSAPSAPPAASIPSEHVEVRRGSYADSVTLMQASRALASVPGVQAALVAMATELNLEVLAGMGFPAPPKAGPNDMLVAVRADEAALARGLAELDAALIRREPAPSRDGGGQPAPRTTGSALRAAGGNLALVSVPGRHAFVEAMDALDAGANVMVFSDNVPVEQEVRLKDAAAARGLLVMGPDCGTAVVGGVGLGFANSVRPGPVGLVAASGTGAQQLMCLLDGAGLGISACLGVGGRDLSSVVGGRATRQALGMLDEDAATELIVLVSKPPAPQVAEEIGQVAAGLGTPVLLALLGPGRPDLSAVAEQACRRLGRPWEQPREWPAPQERRGRYRSLRGLFCGGTLCEEALVIAGDALGAIRSNVPLRPEDALPEDLHADGHVMIDFGDDRLTSGRPHPMIDPSLRLERLAAEARDPAAGVLLLDVVLGYAAHPDPASVLAPAIRAAHESAGASGHEIAVVISLCGTPADPQGLDHQAESLAAAGASVHLSNAAAARKAVELIGRTS